MKNLFFPLLLIALLAASCSNYQHLAVEKGIAIDTLYLNVNYAHAVDSAMVRECETGIENGLARFNRYYARKFVAVRGLEAKEPSLNISIAAAKMASKSNQNAAFFGTFLGLALPVVLIATQTPLIVFFWFPANNKVYLNEGLSPDIRKEKAPERLNVIYKVPGGWLRSSEKNRAITGKEFGNSVYLKLRAVNSSIRP